jgi:hypothetical protein
MHTARLVEKLSHLPRRAVRESLRYCDLARLWLYNRFGSAQVTQPGTPVVSMTTWARRISTAYFAIESIARGSMRPSRMILWIDNEALFRDLPVTLRRLQKRGLEVKACKNYGPHKKYYPYLESEEIFDTPLVTADDDMLYPRFWLKKLVEANRKYPENVNCFWGNVMTVGENCVGRPSEWTQCTSTLPSFRHHAAGVTGVIYPPPFLSALKRAGTAFETCCPKADDLWLHVQALRSGYKIRMILPRLPYFSFLSVPGTHRTGLCIGNVDRDGNNPQVRATYNEADVQLLRAD